MDLSAQQKIAAGSAFVEHLFWKAVLVPTLKAQIGLKYQALRTCELREVKTVRAEIKCIEQLIDMPALIMDSARQELLLDQYAREQSGETEEETED
jgi:hypothetical protein